MSYCTCILIFLFLHVLRTNHGILLNDEATLHNRLLLVESSIQLLTSKLTDLTSKVVKLEQAGRGAVYTIWGRKTCPANGTDLIYTGVAGGGYYSNPGSAAEYVCLPHDPILNNGVSTNPWGLTSHIYGAEYEDDLFGSNVFQKDVPCAVCHASFMTSVMMIPGRNICPIGWKIEYSGNLAAGADTEAAASQFVCVDKSPEILEKGAADENGKLFYPVRAACGVLPCPPYVNNSFLTCTVCSK